MISGDGDHDSWQDHFKNPVFPKVKDLKITLLYSTVSDFFFIKNNMYQLLSKVQRINVKSYLIQFSIDHPRHQKRQRKILHHS